MSATIHKLPGGERNTRLIMSKRMAHLESQAGQAQLREVEELLAAHHLHRLLTKESSKPSKLR